MSVSTINRAPSPSGELSIQTVAMPVNTNPRGDIFAGWLVSQMDSAAGVAAVKLARGRVSTVAIDKMKFLTAVHVGAIVSCYTNIIDVGRSSIRISVEVWITDRNNFEPVKVTEGQFVFVAIDDRGRTRAIQK
ncbi:acyl-CoA thioesterase [Oceanicoccus sp. KOV_DT_Chl]|uniref:acyl-CoA thioesterase n=1 Tax=Oceanicoccus sp. KOV_DT_Chl TaxID=1904639 RepID=UPI000C7B7909|nr:acyl-CoA thioesterase [Oceanicoccus sp. KOV_DT_Chl]